MSYPSHSSSVPSILRIPPHWLKYSSPVAYLLAKSCNSTRTAVLSHAVFFDFCNDEKRFARILLERKSNLWLFRTHQQRFCGDFVIVDMSDPDPEQRKVYALDLKQGASLKQGGGGAGIQFKNVPIAVLDIAERTGIISPELVVEKLCGDASEILAFFGVR
ncbi:hypothetical protein L6R29_15020 [Myxococcota bacterium]|nr:hypothetical protein [Myxococcota bacterium]